ncbi:probable E3 ubiquitin-protein ligase MGRN1 [Panonychus citri]|uniref:probable E3 ubiquitin-protein ligase MGRN1 n=1 Tax=Panonychus citri TaxID=50023 RepID=UPI0023070B81|nr:probable E3 ubiquitin-protein ligase MGRN1 [Panonychus citri]
MGNILDRSRDEEVEEESVDQSSTLNGHHGYLYPPRSGFYFGSHFIMGVEKFETGTPETYLFGDNMDLNFLGPKPIPFPYLAPLPDEPTRSLQALVNIRKETLRLIKIPTIANEFTQADTSSNIITTSTTALTNTIIPTNCGSSSTINSNQITSHRRLASNGSIKLIPTDFNEVKTLPSSSLSTAALPTTSSSSSPQESTKSNASSMSSLNSSTKPAQNQEETNLLLTSSSSPTATTTTTSSSPDQLYTIEFTFDSDVKCSVTIYYLAVEESTPSGNIYVPRDPTYKTATYHYPIGAGQIFSQPSLIFNPTLFNEDDLLYRAIDEFGNFDPTVPFPVVIQLNAEEGSEPRQSHSLIATVERNNEKQFYIKPFKQKIIIDGLAYLIQEVYGIENKNPIHSSTGNGGKASFYSSDEDIEDNGSECVICMSESRDTLILPCRHLCLCNACADSLRYQANNCPICRSPFRALLQFRAVRKIINNAQTVTKSNKKTLGVIQPTTEPLNTSSSSSNINHQSNPPTSSERPIVTVTITYNNSNQTNNNITANSTTTNGGDTKSDIPSGYESISLIEALNGPTLIHSSSSRPGEFGVNAFHSSFDDDDIAPLASIEATTKSISGSSQSMVLTKSSRDIGRQFNESTNSSNTNSDQHSWRHHHMKPSFSSLADISYSVPSSSSSPKLGYRSKSISKSKLLMMANSSIERSERRGSSSENRKGKKENVKSSESLTLWSQHCSPESSYEDQERVKLLDQENYSHHNQPEYHHHHHPAQSKSRIKSIDSPTSIYIESTCSRSRRNLRERGSVCNESELKALNSSLSRDSSNQQLDRDSIDGLDINSINLTSTSYPDLFLQDGVDEQRFMDETDMLSVSTLDSVPNETFPTK